MKINDSLGYKIMAFNLRNNGANRYKIIISGRDFEDVFIIDSKEPLRAIETAKSSVITSRNLSLIDIRFLKVSAQLLPLN